MYTSIKKKKYNVDANLDAPDNVISGNELPLLSHVLLFTNTFIFIID